MRSWTAYQQLLALNRKFSGMLDGKWEHTLGQAATRRHHHRLHAMAKHRDRLYPLAGAAEMGHDIEIRALDTPVFIDQIMVDYDPVREFYIFPVTAEQL